MERALGEEREGLQGGKGWEGRKAGTGTPQIFALINATCVSIFMCLSVFVCVLV